MTFDPLSLRNQFPIFRTNLDKPLFYLDNAASTQMPQTVIDAVTEYETHSRANVSRGVHRLAEAATENFEAARQTVARYIGATSPKEVIFTSGTTDAINLVAQTFGEQLEKGDEVVVTLAEHHSNWVPWYMLAKQKGIILKFLPVEDNGRLDLSKLDQVVTSKCRLIAATHCSNVTGAITDVSALVKAAKSVGAKVLLDGAQMVPHGPVDVGALGVDFYAFSGHKMYAPNGIGVLWGQQSLLETLPPYRGGGGMIRSVSLEGITYAPPPERFEAGTPPIAQAVGLKAAIEWIESIDLHEATKVSHSLMETLLTEMEAQKGLRIIGPVGVNDRLPVVSFTLRDAHPHDVSQILDSIGVAVRGGHHCAQPLMEAYEIDGCTRASFGLYNDYSDVQTLLNGIDKVRGIFS
ncbi:MAG: cysteine desulfurase [Rhodospirillales bacterium]|nr:cysteine desulfurase [Rhodospirillales bacterium]